jgi:hypothetical protein
MQARPKIVKILVVALIVSLVLAACGGGTTGKTWFNLPSAKVQVQPDGAMSVFGFTVGYFPQPALIQQLQAANIQRLEVRIGYNGIHVYANGEDLPYVAWEEASIQTLQAILPSLNLPSGDLIVSALPWLRTIGLGVILDLPLAAGATPLTIPRWSGETAIAPPAAGGETTLGPITLGSLVFDPQGNAIIEGVPLATLEQGLGMAPMPPLLDANTLALLQTVGAQGVQVQIKPDGIYLSLNDQPLPGIAWDNQRLTSLLTALPAFVADPALVATLNAVVPQLTGADITLAVSFTGEQSVETSLAPIEVTLTEDGGLSLFGIALPNTAGTVPADVLANLRAANVQQLNVSLQSNGLFLAANGNTLPTITWTEASLGTVVQVAGVLMGNEAMLQSVVDIATGIAPNLKVNVPPAAGAAAVEIPAEVTFAVSVPAADPQAPALRAAFTVDDQGNTTSLSGITAADLGELGLPGIPLNFGADLPARLADAGIGQVELSTDPGVLNVRFDGSDILALNYDVAALNTALDIATPFIGESPLTNPAINQLLREQILPLVPVAEVDLTFVFE